MMFWITVGGVLVTLIGAVEFFARRRRYNHNARRTIEDDPMTQSARLEASRAFHHDGWNTGLP